MTAINVDGLERLEPVPSDERSKTQSFNIGTRKSKLALVQTELVVEALQRAWPQYDFQIHARDTAAGDLDKVTPFKDMSVKNLWTHELEKLMLEHKLDLLVHSLKDVPTQIPDTCKIGGILARADPRDAFVLKAGQEQCRISDLPAGSVIGTSSIRRTAQIALRHPHLKVQDIRGNVPTRLRKLDAEDSPFDAIVVAVAGLMRLNLGDRISEFLDSEHGGMLYAVGQGAIGVELRSDDSTMARMLAQIEDKASTFSCFAERALLRKLEGGCSAPLGVETRWLPTFDSSRLLQLKAIVVSVDGKESVESTMEAPIKTTDEAEMFGDQVAADLLSRGADRILAAIQAKKMTKPTDLNEET